MNDSKRILLEYIRTLYDRQNSKASMAGMTHWAILAGVIYVTWHFLDAFSAIEVSDTSKLDFYRVFSQMFLAILALSFLVNSNAISRNKEYFDYRIFRQDDSAAKMMVLASLVLGPPLYAMCKLRGEDPHASFLSAQAAINFWVTLTFIVLFFLFGLLQFLKNSESSLPPVSDFMPRNATSIKVVYFVLHAVFFLLLIGNVVNIGVDVYGAGSASKLEVAAFDLSLIILGLIMLFGSGETAKQLEHLARFERDIVIHDLSESEIIERLQNEFLGIYIGDWMKQQLADIKQKSNHLTEYAEEGDQLIADVGSIDEKYSLERNGRVNKYLMELESRHDAYTERVTPLLKWLNDASVQSTIFKDSIMFPIVKETAAALKKEGEIVGAKVSSITEKLKEVLSDCE